MKSIRLRLLSEMTDMAVQELVDDAVSKGARVLCGGSPPSHLPHGHFFSPTLIADALPSMRVFAEETFAPVIPLFPCGPTCSSWHECRNQNSSTNAMWSYLMWNHCQIL